MKTAQQELLSKKLIFLFLLLYGLYTWNNGVQPARASSITQNIMDDQLSKLGVEDIKEYWTTIMTDYEGFLPETQKGSLMEFIKGEKDFSIKAWALGILKYLFYEVLIQGKLLGTLILLTVFSMLLQTIQNAFEHHTISKVAYSIIYMVLIILALNSFHIAMQYAQESISTMMNFMMALVPLLLALMATVGSVTSVAFFHPVIVFLVNSSGLLINNFVLPLLFLSALLSIVSTLSEHHKVTQLAKLLRSIGMGALAVFFTVFLSVISVQGATTAVADGITVKTAKFITGNFIPVVGRMFTDATDTVMSASVLLKNTVGIAGVAILFLLAVFPAIKVLALGFIYSFAAAVLQPLGGGPIIECLGIIGKSVLYIFAALATVSIMFFLAVTVIVAAGNLSLMIR
ncbi:stage III sporulation protein AE [Fictibacillus sp. WQ 8-8]|uniref:stage III sporulation protein AE n=1 Tax=unclassified Fictibacillus TaxID=2644029 RepID=UPI0006A797AA|nr:MULTISPECIES: stage III sporulation protein AE [unclassified Fictibacillus]MCQ6266171.1 stage III sporulation protein AE [Fictibacillus sp. WQ 8-8]MED2972609.1 stage III sporulation protein AE [Fictibacillus sp. B-59209]SFD69991.1 stage III sporulation protein AE [Bacillus sp. OV194]